MFVSREKRALTAFVPALVSLMAVLLTGCSRSEPPAPSASTAASVPSADAQPGEGPLKVAFVYIGPVGNSGWTYAHDQARQSLEAELGDRIKTTFVESVPEGAEAEKTSAHWLVTATGSSSAPR